MPKSIIIRPAFKSIYGPPFYLYGGIKFSDESMPLDILREMPSVVKNVLDPIEKQYDIKIDLESSDDKITVRLPKKASLNEEYKQCTLVGDREPFLNFLQENTGNVMLDETGKFLFNCNLEKSFNPVKIGGLVCDLNSVILDHAHFPYSTSSSDKQDYYTIDTKISQNWKKMMS